MKKEKGCANGGLAGFANQIRAQRPPVAPAGPSRFAGNVANVVRARAAGAPIAAGAGQPGGAGMQGRQMFADGGMAGKHGRKMSPGCKGYADGGSVKSFEFDPNWNTYPRAVKDRVARGASAVGRAIVGAAVEGVKKAPKTKEALDAVSEYNKKVREAG